MASGILRAQQTPQEKQLFQELNEARRKAGQPLLVWDERLAQAARRHTKLMANKNQLGHVLAEEPSVKGRIAATGIRFNANGENVGYNTYLNDMTDAWLSSPGHRKNMLSPDYDVVGIGIVRGSNGLFYATQDFAHTVVILTNAQATERVVAAIQRLRLSARRNPLEVIDRPEVRDLACKLAKRGKLNAREASMLPDVSAAVTYNNSQPDTLPADIHKLVSLTKFTQLAVGACFTEGDQRNPFGMFFVVVAFY